MFVVPEKQYYNCEKYEHSTTDSVTVRSHSVVLETKVSYKDKVYTGYKVQHCTKIQYKFLETLGIWYLIAFDLYYRSCKKQGII